MTDLGSPFDPSAFDDPSGFGEESDAFAARRARIVDALLSGETGVQYESLALFAEPLFTLYDLDPADAFTLRTEPETATETPTAAIARPAMSTAPTACVWRTHMATARCSCRGCAAQRSAPKTRRHTRYSSSSRRNQPTTRWPRSKKTASTTPTMMRPSKIVPCAITQQQR